MDFGGKVRTQIIMIVMINDDFLLLYPNYIASIIYCYKARLE